mgnify:CR=1 FL=1
MVTSSTVPSARLARWLLLPLLLVGVGLAGPAQAQNDVRTIDFDEAVRIALDQNTDLKRAANQVQRQDAQVQREYMDFVPNLNLSSSTTRRFGLVRDQQTFQLTNRTLDQFTLNGSTGITVFNGFENFASLQRSSLNAQASSLSLERTRQDVVFAVMDRYITLVQNQELIGVRQEELDVQEQQLEQIREFVEAGAQPRSDLFQQEANVAAAEQQLLTAEREAALSETRLIQTLQLDPLVTYAFEAPSVDEQNFRTATYDLNTLLNQAFQRRTDLQAQEIGVRAAEQNVRAARSGYFPSLSLNFGYGTDWSSSLSDVIRDPETGEIIEDNISFFDHLDNRKGGQFGFSINIPVFNRMQTRNQITQAQIDLQNAKYQLDDQQQAVALEVRQAYLDYQNAEKQLDVAGKRLRAAERAREATQERYNLGAASFVELAQVNADFVSAASEQVRARYNFLFQTKLIDYYLGVLDPSVSLFQ